MTKRLNETYSIYNRKEATEKMGVKLPVIFCGFFFVVSNLLIV